MSGLPILGGARVRLCAPGSLRTAAACLAPGKTKSAAVGRDPAVFDPGPEVDVEKA